MKKFLSMTTLVFAASFLLAQQVPQGMKYQAVARDAKGIVLASIPITLRINLYSDKGGANLVHYSEVHNVVSNELGLFTLVIGDGKSESGRLTDVPWSTNDIWMEIAISDNSKNAFTVISNSKLLSVPYAFHAGTASKVISGVNSTMAAKPPTGGGTDDGTDAQVWQLFGNLGTDPATAKLGTTDGADLRIVSNNIERVRVLSGGNINILNDLDVGKNVLLNTTSGHTTNNGNFTVANLSATSLTGTLTVDKATNLNDILNVNNSKSTYLSGTLTVDKGTNLNDILNVNNEKSTYLSGSLTADKLIRFSDGTQSTSSTTGAMVVSGGAGIVKNLYVGGDLNVAGLATLKNLSTESTTSKSLSITDNSPGYLATFTNTNNGNGDGVKIKLGKTHPAWDGSSYAHIQNTYAEFMQPPINFVNDVLINKTKDFSVQALFEAFPTSLFTAGVVALTNAITLEINDALDLPNTIIPETDLLLSILQSINGTDACGGGACSSAGDCFVPDELICAGEDAYVGGQLIFPAVTIPAIPQIPTDGLPSFSLFNIEFTDVANSLTIQNEFLVFTDKDDRKLGSIRAQSINDWRANYIDGSYIINLVSQFIKIDIMNAIFSVVNEATVLVDAYNSIGVEYNSGNGDYAEWLERANPNEHISYGDIVAVKGGKITKDLTSAEQIMAVSHKPIVLGNIPDKERIHLGENIAFMGQIPVKVIGTVHSGDYIVAKSDVPGYGVAVSPLNMQVEDYKLAVGRSWVTNESDGPKMVNTVVGVHNNGFLDIIRGLKEKTESNEMRLKAIEAKLNITSETNKTIEKKPF